MAVMGMAANPFEAHQADRHKISRVASRFGEAAIADVRRLVIRRGGQSPPCCFYLLNPVHGDINCFVAISVDQFQAAGRTSSTVRT